MSRISNLLVAISAVVLSYSCRPAEATSIGTLTTGSHFSGVITFAGPSFSQDYTFHLNNTVGGLTILATAFGQTSPDFGVDSLSIKLFDASSTLLATATGASIAALDSFNVSGSALHGGNYLLSILGNVTPGKRAFVSVSVAANSVAPTPIPTALLMGMTGLGLLGGVTLYRRRRISVRTAMGPGLA